MFSLVSMLSDLGHAQISAPEHNLAWHYIRFCYPWGNYKSVKVSCFYHQFEQFWSIASGLLVTRSNVNAHRLFYRIMLFQFDLCFEILY